MYYTGQREISLQIHGVHLTQRTVLAQHAVHIHSMGIKVVNSINEEDNDSLAWRAFLWCFFNRVGSPSGPEARGEQQHTEDKYSSTEQPHQRLPTKKNHHKTFRPIGCESNRKCWKRSETALSAVLAEDKNSKRDIQYL
jgi:hypothetical protein